VKIIFFTFAKKANLFLELVLWNKLAALRSLRAIKVVPRVQWSGFSDAQSICSGCKGAGEDSSDRNFLPTILEMVPSSWSSTEG
jgi:hypothetical protein